MTKKKEILYLLQVSLVFLLIGLFKIKLLLVPATLLIVVLPFNTPRKFTIQKWQELGILLGKVLSPAIIFLVYFLGLTPLALIRRILGADVLQLKKPQFTNFKSLKKSHFTNESFDDYW
jgi:hypothetical protein